MSSSSNINRRKAIKAMALGSSAMALPNLVSSRESFSDSNPLKGNVNHSVCQWCYGDIPLEVLAREAKKLGLVGIDLIGPDSWDILKKYDLDSTMCNGAELNLVDGFNDVKFHNKLIPRYMEHIDLVSKAGYKNLICFSGNRRGMDDELGLKNSVKGLKAILSHAEKKGVVLTMELLNSKVDHSDYMCDNSNWGVALCKELDSDNFKLLYDIYHMQIMEGDVIRTIQENHKYYGHYHTAGVPGRNEIDETQELYYPAIMEAILKTGFKGIVAQEFIPQNRANNGFDSLADSIRRCDV
ncbi:TIM barrel protein [Flavobacteriaceae bacterium]|jgi:hydroxypyruvate isomerase|nr:TIM barrel protein [Flavobacteriaceae bacterium]|tara:strand:+ start:253 stop:1143 length:891 start_codon:yes stop_codon:yes gene_type:complete